MRQNAKSSYEVNNKTRLIKGQWNGLRQLDWISRRPERGVVLTFMSRCMTFLEWMNATPSQIWRAKQTHAFSVNMKSSLTALSNSSPPYTLHHITAHQHSHYTHVYSLYRSRIWILLFFSFYEFTWFLKLLKIKIQLFAQWKTADRTFWDDSSACSSVHQSADKNIIWHLNSIHSVSHDVK